MNYTFIIFTLCNVQCVLKTSDGNESIALLIKEIKSGRGKARGKILCIARLKK